MRLGDTGVLRGLQQGCEELGLADEEFGLSDFDVVSEFERGVSRVGTCEDCARADDGEKQERIVDVVEGVDDDTVTLPYTHVAKAGYQLAYGRAGLQV